MAERGNELKWWIVSIHQDAAHQLAANNGNAFTARGGAAKRAGRLTIFSTTAQAMRCAGTVKIASVSYHIDR